MTTSSSVEGEKTASGAARAGTTHSGQDGGENLDARDGVQNNDLANGGHGGDSCSTDPRDARSSC